MVRSCLQTTAAADTTGPVLSPSPCPPPAPSVVRPNHQQCAAAPGTPPPATAPALGKAGISRISETGESDFSSAQPGMAATAASFRGLAQAAGPPQVAEGSGDEEEKSDRWGEQNGYGTAMSGQGLGEEPRSGDGDGNAGGGGGGGGDEPPALCYSPPSRGMLPVHHWVGSYEVFMDYDPTSK